MEENERLRPESKQPLPPAVGEDSRAAPLFVAAGQGAVPPGLPPMENLGTYETIDPPPLQPEVIHGVLRKTHTMLLAGPSKSGKSFALIELAVALAGGGSWLGARCTRSRVLYVNLEIDRASCLHRFLTVADAMNVPADTLEQIDVWNLRGLILDLPTLAPLLIERAQAAGTDVIILDPLYMLISGDENSASDMAKFCRWFSLIASATGCSLCYAHHHSKSAAQNYKKAMDRASGSGVFARYPDAILDLTELPLTHIPSGVYPVSRPVTAWRVSYTLREFAQPPDTDVWFDFPLHRIDDTGRLQYVRPDVTIGGRTYHQKDKSDGSLQEQRKEAEREEVKNAYIVIAGSKPPDPDGVVRVRVKDLTDRCIEAFGRPLARSTLYKKFQQSGDFLVEDGVITPVKREPMEGKEIA